MHDISTGIYGGLLDTQAYYYSSMSCNGCTEMDCGILTYTQPITIRFIEESADEEARVEVSIANTEIEEPPGFEGELQSGGFFLQEHFIVFGGKKFNGKDTDAHTSQTREKKREGGCLVQCPQTHNSVVVFFLLLLSLYFRWFASFEGKLELISSLRPPFLSPSCPFLNPIFSIPPSPTAALVSPLC